MARYIGPVCRICRRENELLFLKGPRCYTDKCGFTRRSYPPGQHGPIPRKPSPYALQLREKQKLKRMYGLLERQFRLTFLRAQRMKGVTGDNLLTLLEIRLDNTVYRAGFAVSRRHARQLVRHGHMEVNGRRVNIPSFQVTPGDVIEVRAKSKKLKDIQDAKLLSSRRGRPSWLEVDDEALRATVLGLPGPDDLVQVLPGGTGEEPKIKTEVIVELYSK